MIYFFLFILSFFLCLYFTPLVRDAALKYDIVDKPDGELKNHEKPVAYMGGIAVYIAFLLTLALAFDFRTEVLGLLLSGTIIILIGMIDDLKPLSPQIKLLGQAIAVFALMKSGIYIKLVFLPHPVALTLTFIWLITMINAFNIIDVMDGLATGIALIASVFFFLIALMTQNPLVAVLAITLAGTAAGFLKYNFTPAKIYLGDSGSMFLGLMLGSFSMIISHTKFNSFAWLAPLLLLGIPLFDMILVVVMRWKKGIPIMHGSPDHFALRVKKLNRSTKQTVCLSYAVAIAMGACAMFMISTTSKWLCIGIFSGALILMIFSGVVIVVKSDHR